MKRARSPDTPESDDQPVSDLINLPRELRLKLWSLAGWSERARLALTCRKLAPELTEHSLAIPPKWRILRALSRGGMRTIIDLAKRFKLDKIEAFRMLPIHHIHGISTHGIYWECMIARGVQRRLIISFNWGSDDEELLEADEWHCFCCRPACIPGLKWYSRIHFGVCRTLPMLSIKETIALFVTRYENPIVIDSLTAISAISCTVRGRRGRGRTTSSSNTAGRTTRSRVRGDFDT